MSAEREEKTIAIDEAKLNAFLGRTVGDVAAVWSASLMVLGEELGLYAAMAGSEPMTADEVATRTGTDARLVAEWLANQAAGGIVEYDSESGRFTLPPEQAFILTDPASPADAVDLILGGILVAEDRERLVRAFRGQGELGWDDHPSEFFAASDRYFAAGSCFLGLVLPGRRVGIHDRPNGWLGCLDHHTYEPFGKLTAGDPANPFTYSGREWDSTVGMQLNRARYYSPTHGRFASEDPVGERGGMNLYQYAASSPVIFTDPMGLALAREPFDFTPVVNDLPTAENLNCGEQIAAVGGAFALVEGIVAVGEFVLAGGGWLGVVAAVTSPAALILATATAVGVGLVWGFSDQCASG